MGLRRNILASYLSQGYITVISIVTMPVYLRFLGAESYGLVGFFAMLQAWFMLLDVGLTPTLARETARFHGSALSARAYSSLVRILEFSFLVIALFGGAVLYATSGYLAHHWLRVSEASVGQIESALKIIAIIIALRWMSGLYKSIVGGAERLVWLGSFGAAVATLRFVGVLLVLNYVGATAVVFFWYQLGVACIEILVLIQYAHRLVPKPTKQESIAQMLSTVRPMVRFSLTLAFTASVWILVTQTDKLVLSKILPLAQYGYFSLAVLVANGVMVISGPVSGALMPRMARMEAEGDRTGLVQVYRSSTQFVVVVAASVSLTLALNASNLLLAWTGNRELAAAAAPILALYALGNGILAVSAFPYYLQYAKGHLRMHLIGNMLFVVFLIPLIAWSARNFGGIGAARAWLAINIVYMLAWVPLTHFRIQPGLNLRWFTRDILMILAPITVVGIMVSNNLPTVIDGNRWLQLGSIAIVFVIMAAVGAGATSKGCAKIKTGFFFPKVAS